MNGSRYFVAAALILLGALAGALVMGVLPGKGLSIDDAVKAAERYRDGFGDPDIEVDEVMEFEYNFYVIYYEESTGVGAFEMLIDRSTGRIYPEYGPNMMWNTKYGHGGMMGPSMMGGGTGPPTVDEEEALTIAQEWLDRVYPGTEAEESHPFYGYYTVHTMRGGVVTGMLSVNQYTGAVWYHNWHGAYIRSVELH